MSRVKKYTELVRTQGLDSNILFDFKGSCFGVKATSLPNAFFLGESNLMFTFSSGKDEIKIGFYVRYCSM